MHGISRQSAPIHVIVHYPKTVEGKRALSQQTADVYAETVIQFLQKLRCPSPQKLQILDTVIQAAKKQAGENVP